MKTEAQPPIRLYIFDFDGTLADTREIIVRTNQEVQRRMGFAPLPEEKILPVIGIPLDDGILTMIPGLTREELPAWRQMYRDVFSEMKSRITPALFPPVRETLEALCARGCALTVASSRGLESLRDFLREMDLAPYFRYVLGADNVTRAKPDPEPVLKTLRELGFTPEETLVVGDMPVDIRMGLGAGARTCGVTFGNADREMLLEAGAHHVIDDFTELLTIR